MTALEVYNGSDGDVTTAYYKQLEERGAIGRIAMNLFRAQKCSSRAKKYRRRAHKGEAYDRKNWSMRQLCEALQQNESSCRGIRWGWKQDPKCIGFEWVLYVDLPQGQVSFHSPTPGAGRDYQGEWDGQRKSSWRILAFCDNVMGVSDPHREMLYASLEIAESTPQYSPLRVTVPMEQDSLFQTSGEGE